MTGKSKTLSFSEPPDRADRTPLSDALLELEKLTRLLRRDAQAIAFQTFIVVFASAAFNLGLLFNITLRVFVTSITAVATIAFVTLLLAVHFEAIRKRGDILFKEISDELQWNVRFLDSDDERSNDMPAPQKRPQLRARLTLRSFAQASDLPLIPGRYGPLTYALFGIFSVVASILIIVASARR